jgi:putative transposase
MWVYDAKIGRVVLRKCRQSYDVEGHAHFLTFSCFHQLPMLSRDRTRLWFVEALRAVQRRQLLQLWAYVIMPEHVHLLVFPCGPHATMASILQAMKEPVARQAIAYLHTHAPHWLPKVTVQEGKRIRHRFWQPGGGYDRNLTDLAALRAVIDYIHANPVRRGLVEQSEEWEWSSARFYAGMKPVQIEMDPLPYEE